jgi:hypothetical protein
MGENGSRSLNRAFLPGQTVSPSQGGADPALEARVADLEAQVAALQAAMPTANQLVPTGGANGTVLTRGAGNTSSFVALPAGPTAGQLVPIGTGAVNDVLVKTGANASQFETRP